MAEPAKTSMREIFGVVRFFDFCNIFRQKGAGWLSAPPTHRERQAMTTAIGYQARSSRQGFV